MIDLFNRICQVETFSFEENIDKPYKDISQDTWLTYFERLDNIPSAETFEELVQVFGDDAPLLATIYRARAADFQRSHKGTERNSPNKYKLLRESFSLDRIDENGELVGDVIEDAMSTLPFTQIEESDVLKDERIADLPPSHQEAIKRFILAWYLIEEGYKIPGKISTRIARDRKLTGLPLVLPKGPKNTRK